MQIGGGSVQLNFKGHGIKLKKLIKNYISKLVWIIGGTRLGGYAYEAVLKYAIGVTQSVSHRKTRLQFFTPNKLNRFRIDTFSTKEPETLDWIDAIPSGSVLWDVGANIGLYSCYAAKTHDISVYAFEPSVFNLELLAKNININQLSDRVVIVPLPLADSVKVSKLNMTSREWGGALSTFGESYGDDGKPMKKVFDFSTIGISMNDAVSLLNIPQPTHIKIDVDGIEQLILAGGGRVLQNVKEVAIEVNDDFYEQSVNVNKLLSDAGLKFKGKKHSEMFDKSTRFNNTYNQVWCRV